MIRHRLVLSLPLLALVFAGCAPTSKMSYREANYHLPRVQPLPILPLESTDRFSIAAGGAFRSGEGPTGLSKGDSSGRLTLGTHYLAGGLLGAVNVRSIFAGIYLSEQIDKTDGNLSMVDPYWALMVGASPRTPGMRTLFFGGIGMASFGRSLYTDSSFTAIHDSANDYPLILGVSAIASGKQPLKPYAGLTYRHSMNLPGFWKDNSEKRNVLDLSQIQIDLGARFDPTRMVGILGGMSWNVYQDERIKGSDWRVDLGIQYHVGSR